MLARTIRGPLMVTIGCLLAAPAVHAQQGFTIDDALDVRGVAIADVSDDGRWVAVTTTSLRDRLGVDNRRFGDPTYIAPSVAEVSVLDTRTGRSTNIFPAKRQVRSLEWSPDGTRLAMLLRDGDAFRLAVWDREAGRLRMLRTPDGMVLVPSASPAWSPDGEHLLVELWSRDHAQRLHARFVGEVEGPVVVQSSADPFLSWEQIRRLAAERAVGLIDVARGRYREVRPAGRLQNVRFVGTGDRIAFAEDITQKTSYDEIFGSESNLKVLPLQGGEPHTVFETTKGLTLRWSGDGTAYAYAKDDQLFFGRLDDAEPRRLAGEPPRRDSTAAPADSAARAAERERREKERLSPLRLSEDGTLLIARNAEALWILDTANGERTKLRDLPDAEDRTAPRWDVTAWSRDGRDIYLTRESRTEWQRGLYRYDRSTGETTELVNDAFQYSGVRVSDDGSTLVFSRAAGNHPADLYVADRDFRDVRRLTDANPGLAPKLARTELVSYLDADGDRLHGVLYYPLGYQTGTKVPTIFIVYESFFDDRFNATVNYLTSNGYAVMQPSVELERGYPGEAWLKGVTAAANRLIEMGVADPERLGVHGTSYGGYATNLLITQTDRFAAAINISGKVDMISFYTDSPRLGVRNIHAPEKSQDRIGATLWEQPQKYVAHSAIMFADRIDTPLLLMTGAQDHNVPERTTMEMFYALRRLGKTVEWVSYTDGGHGMPTTRVEEVRDYHERIRGWYDRWLKKSAAAADGG